MEAESYSGNGRVYSKTVPLTDVAWIDPTQGQYAPVDRTMYSMSEPTDAQQDEAERLLFQGVDADTIREMTGLERTEDHGWRFTVDTTPEAAYDGGRTTDQQGGLDDGQNEYDLRGVHGENVRRREAGELSQEDLDRLKGEMQQVAKRMKEEGVQPPPPGHEDV